MCIKDLQKYDTQKSNEPRKSIKEEGGGNCPR